MGEYFSRKSKLRSSNFSGHEVRIYVHKFIDDPFGRESTSGK